LDVKDPIAPIEDILQRQNKNDLLLMYKIADFNNVTEFLANIAVARGKLSKVCYLKV
jgi:nuclear GTP-binding protein